MREVSGGGPAWPGRTAGGGSKRVVKLWVIRVGRCLTLRIPVGGRLRRWAGPIGVSAGMVASWWPSWILTQRLTTSAVQRVAWMEVVMIAVMLVGGSCLLFLWPRE